jgi:hypothetical protein
MQFNTHEAEARLLTCATISVAGLQTLKIFIRIFEAYVVSRYAKWAEARFFYFPEVEDY